MSTFMRDLWKEIEELGADDGAAKGTPQPPEATETTATADDPSFSPPQWESLRLDPVKETMVVGHQQQFTASTVCPDNDALSQDVTQMVIWGSSDPDVLAIDDKDHKGLAKAGSKTGSVVIAATDPSGEHSVEVKITVKAAVATHKQPPKAAKPPALTEIRVSPADLEQISGAKDQLNATGVYHDGSVKDLTHLVHWEVDRGTSSPR
jgi:hypothetical protein